MAVEKWRSYLHGREFILKTDHQSLLHLIEQTVTSRLQQKALLKLMDLQYKIQFKKGVTNTAADALSRMPDQEIIHSISTSTLAWLERLQQGYEEDGQDRQLLTELALSSQNDKGYILVNGIIKHKGRVWVGNNTPAQQHILQALHASGLGGHSGIQSTYHRVKALFSWPKLKQVVTNYVQSCTVCQQAKVEHSRLLGLLQPLPVLDSAWSIVSMDFIEGLPKAGKNDTILVVIDKFIKYAYFLALSHPYTALSVAQLYFSTVYMGYPRQSYQIETGCLPAHFGRSCSHYLMLSY